MTAEILKLTVPKLVELHNYPPANSAQQKLVNWHTLNCTLFINYTEGNSIDHLPILNLNFLPYLFIDKVLRKIGFYLTEDTLLSIVNNHPGVIESVLIQLQRHASSSRFKLNKLRELMYCNK